MSILTKSEHDALAETLQHTATGALDVAYGSVAHTPERPRVAVPSRQAEADLRALVTWASDQAIASLHAWLEALEDLPEVGQPARHAAEDTRERLRQRVELGALLGRIWERPPADFDLAADDWPRAIVRAIDDGKWARTLTSIRAAPEAIRLSDALDELIGAQGRDRRRAKVYAPTPRDADRRQRVLGRNPSFVGITFLERGLVCARSVVKISFHMAGLPYHGTAFLIRPDLLLTNHHNVVDDDGALAEGMQATFDYDGEGALGTVVDIGVTTPVTGNKTGDWAALTLPARVTDRQPLRLSTTPAKAGDFVSIIQHPFGSVKKLALHHNNVTHAGADSVHYMTDTARGSSGSPVFNSDWEVVALHREGGPLNLRGTTHNVYRNEGTPIAAVRLALENQGIPLP